MKIQSSTHTPPLGTTPRGAARDVPGAERKPGQPATQVELSDDARFLAKVREDIQREPAVRQDVVDRVKQAIEDGTYEGSVDLDLVVSRLMGDL